MSKKKLLTLYQIYHRQIHVLVIAVIVIGCLFGTVTLIHTMVGRETDIIAKESAASEPKTTINDVVPSFLQSAIFSSSSSAK